MVENCIKEEVRSPSPEIKDCYLKDIFPNMLSKTSLDFIPYMEVTDHKHYADDIGSKTENLRLQKCSLKIRFYWKLVISQETFMKWRQ